MRLTALDNHPACLALVGKWLGHSLDHPLNELETWKKINHRIDTILPLIQQRISRFNS